MPKPFELSYLEHTHRVTSRIGKMVKFELAKEIEKDVYFRLVASVGRRKNSEFP